MSEHGSRSQTAPHSEETPAELVEGVSRVIADYVQRAAPTGVQRGSPGGQLEAGAGGRLEAGAELGLLLQQTADQLEAMQETQKRLLDTLASGEQHELTLQTVKSLNYAFRELTDSQEKLAGELARQRRWGRAWLLFALLVLGILGLVGFGAWHVYEATREVRADRDEVAAAVASMHDELDSRSRELRQGALDLADLRDEIANRVVSEHDDELERLTERHSNEIGSLRTKHDERVFELESRIAEIQRDRDFAAQAQKIMQEKLTDAGRELEHLRTSNEHLERELTISEGRLAAAELPRPTGDLRPGEVRWEAPGAAEGRAEDDPTGTELTASPPVEEEPARRPEATRPEATRPEGRSPESGRAGSDPVGATVPPTREPESPGSTSTTGSSDPANRTGTEPGPRTAPSDAGATALLQKLLDEGLVGAGSYHVVRAAAGPTRGAFQDVVIERTDDGKLSRRYAASSVQLIVKGPGRGVFRMEDGTLTIIGWQGERQFASDVPSKRFDLAVEVGSMASWQQAGAIPE